MKPSIAGACLALLLGLATASAHAAADPATADVPTEAKDATAVVDRFSAALATGDLATVEALLAPDVLVLESGGAERSRAQYLAQHAGADAAFLANAHVQPVHRSARVVGDLAWVGTEAEIHASEDGMPLTLLATETMVLRRSPEGWRIVHIHWSSRNKNGASPN